MRCEREEQQERQQDQQPDLESVAPALHECYNQKKLTMGQVMAWARVQRSSDDQQRISALALEEKW